MAYPSIGPITVDIFTSEAHSLPSETTDFAREGLTDASDNTRAMPITLSVEGVISDTPLGDELIRIRQRETAGIVSPSEFAFTQFEQIYKTREPVTVRTSLRTYTNMVMTSCDVNRTKDNARGLAFTCSFKKLEIVTNRRTVVTAVLGAKGVDRGFKAPKTSLTQTIKTADGSLVSQTVYDNGPKASPRYTYADGSIYKNKTQQTLTPAKAEKVKLDKHGATKQRKGQTRGPLDAVKGWWQS